MDIIDKHRILDDLSSRQKVILELGCGNRKRDPSWIGIDTLDYDCVDIVGDVYGVLSRIPDGSIDEVHSFHFLEHLVDLDKILEELGRVIKEDGQAEIVVPHFSNPYYYSDYTHKRTFGLYSFSYLADDKIFRRGVPKYSKAIYFELYQVDLLFKSTPPFYARHAFKKLVGILFNSNRYMKELYEEFFCYLIPCYEIRFLLQRKQI
jgi:predicted SAM-dependent methyltransferase